MISNFSSFELFQSENGTLTPRAFDFLRQMVRQINLNTVLSGSGSPEGVIEAIPTQLYMDTAGTAGSILYVKKTGTSNTGWILV